MCLVTWTPGRRDTHPSFFLQARIVIVTQQFNNSQHLDTSENIINENMESDHDFPTASSEDHVRPPQPTDSSESEEVSESEKGSDYEESPEPEGCLICGGLDISWDSDILETNKFIASADSGACSTCEMLEHGLSLVTDLQLVTKIRFDFLGYESVMVHTWRGEDEICSYEFFLSSSSGNVLTRGRLGFTPTKQYNNSCEQTINRECKGQCLVRDCTRFTPLAR